MTIHTEEVIKGQIYIYTQFKKYLFMVAYAYQEKIFPELKDNKLLNVDISADPKQVMCVGDQHNFFFPIEQLWNKQILDD